MLQVGQRDLIREVAHQPANWVVPVAAVLTVALAMTLPLVSTVTLTVLAAIVLTVIEVALLGKVAHGFTPVMIPVVLINGVLVLGNVLFSSLAESAAVSASLPTDTADIERGLLVALGFTGAVTVGGLLVSRPASGRTDTALRVKPGILLLVGYVPLLLAVIGRGSALWYAPEYLSHYGPAPAVIVGSALAPVAALALSLAAFQKGSGRVLAVLGLMGWATVHFAVGTRELALMPGLLLIGFLLTGGTQRRRLGIAKPIVVIVATLLLAQLVLELRGNPAGVGLVPFLDLLQSSPDILLQLNPAAVLGNLLFAAPLTGYVSQTHLSVSAFWTSVNPLPGGMTDWPALAPRLRVNDFTPYNGLGELGAHGWLYVLGFGLMVGLVLAVTHRSSTKTDGALGLVGVVLVVALAVLFSVLLIQYNLRSTTRILWYLVFAVTLIRAFAAAHRMGPRKGHSPVSSTSICSS